MVTQGNGFSFDNPEAFTRMWTEFVSKMSTAGVSFSPDSPPPEASRQVRNAMLDALGRYCEEYMRSPQFLQTMKQSMDGAVAFRKQLNAFFTRWQHEMQGVAQEDVDSLMDRMGDLQKTVVRRIDAISGRLDEIATRLDRLEGRGPTEIKKATAPAGRKMPAGKKSGSVKSVKSTKTTKPSKKRTRK